MLPIILPITLATAGAAALINLWLALRVGRTRTSEKVSIGDGGNVRLIARMRAHSNFSEYTPIVLILIAVAELATGTSVGLWAAAAVFLIGRIAHGFGMDGWRAGRMFGTAATMLIMVGLGLYAIAIPYLSPSEPITTEMIQAG